MNRESVDSYLTDGCGRCDKYRTPQCKVHRWTDTLRALRAVLQDTELVETMKWGAPCYTLDGTNIAMMGAFTSFASVMFFRGPCSTTPPSDWSDQGRTARPAAGCASPMRRPWRLSATYCSASSSRPSATYGRDAG